MKIGIDATTIGTGDGASNYMYNLTKNLLLIDKNNDYLIYCRGQVPEGLQAINSRGQFKVSTLKNRRLCEQVWLSLKFPFDSLDVLHCCWSLPLFYPKRSILTVHGLSWRIMPEIFPTSHRLYWKFATERTAKKAKRLIAISEWTKQLLVKDMGISERIIDVVHHGVDPEIFFQIQDSSKIDELKTKYKLPDAFILYVGSILPVKNVPTLIKSFSRLVSRKEFKHYHLVIAGAKAWGYQSAYDLVKNLGIEEKVIFTGFFPAEDLPTLYNSAELYVLPSFFEGFGIPIMESFACGTPVITSNVSCLPEVAGDAALLFNPQNVDELADAMAKVLSEHPLRETMVEKGTKRAKEFTWKRAAEKTLKAYEKAFSE
jgi:glycosyltransferase involved in cell wall biosynthesis